MYVWNEYNEKRLIEMKDKEYATYQKIADELGTTISSVKHKYVRLKQKANEDKHHHPTEKLQQISRLLPLASDLKIIELFCGWGNLTSLYSKYGHVLAMDIDDEKISWINELGINNCRAIKVDSFREIYKLIYQKNKFDVIDIDPYGYPSRLFPHIFELIDRGLLFITFPKMGIQQINKIMIEHYRVFWGLTLEDKEDYLNKIVAKITDYALCNFRVISLIDVVDLGRMYRLAFNVRRESALKIVGLEVNKGLQEFRSESRNGDL